jgi:hypothetical protein
MKLSVHPKADVEGPPIFNVHLDGVYGPLIASCPQRHWAEAIVLALSLGELVGKVLHHLGLFMLASVGRNRPGYDGPTPGSVLVEVRELAKEAQGQLDVLDALVDDRAPKREPAATQAKPRHLH